MIATMMPKPISLDNGSGMHVNVSLWNGGRNLFYDASDEYAEMSENARYFGGGIIDHAKALGSNSGSNYEFIQKISSRI